MWDAKERWPEYEQYVNMNLLVNDQPAGPVAPVTIHDVIAYTDEATAADYLTHGGHPEQTGGMAVEYYWIPSRPNPNYNLYAQMYNDRMDDLVDEFGSDDIGLGMVVFKHDSLEDTVRTLGLTHEGISNHLSQVSDDALLTGMFCYSCYYAPDWLLGADGAMPCFSTGVDSSCGIAASIMYVLGCGGHPELSPNVEDATWFADNTPYYGDGSKKYSYTADCRNPAAAFNGAFAFDDRVVFRTVSERGSVLFFVLGVDSWRDAARDWKSWDVLARVSPQGGPNVIQLYDVGGVPDRALYMIAEVDAQGRPSFSEPFVRGRKPPDYDLWTLHRTVMLTADTATHDTASELREWTGSESHPHTREFAVPAKDGFIGRLNGGRVTSARPDSSDCADIVVYTSTAFDSLLVPVQQHLSNAGIYNKVRYFTGSSDLEDARDAYNDVYFANYAFNQSSSTSRFPVDDPGPLLLIVGDSQEAGGVVVDHITFEDTYDRCIGACHSDRDATDIDGGTGRVGMAHRIPGDTVAEIERACQAADDWNHGVNVDPQRHLIRTMGNRYGSGIYDGPIDLAEEVAQSFQSEGYPARPLLASGDFDLYDYANMRAAFNSQLADGAAIIWGYDMYGANCDHWPGYFMGPPDTTLHRTQQRMVAIFPVCNTAAIYWPEDWNSALVKKWEFFNPRFTQMAGMIGHLDGGWAHQHEEATRLYTEAWAEAPTDAPLDWVVWRACQMAEEQGLDWMEDYLRSAVTMGGYVLAHPGGDEVTSLVLTESDSLLFCPAGGGEALADSVTAIVTVRDGDGNPVVGVEPEDISLYGGPSGQGCTFALVCGDSCYAGPCLHPSAATDTNGQAFIPIEQAGGHDPAGWLTAVVDLGGLSHYAETSLEAKSPDINGDGIVGLQDWALFSADYGQNGSDLRSDLNYDDHVGVQDAAIMSAHYGHTCTSGRTLAVPPELLALLGLDEDAADDTRLPTEFTLGQNTPNPFNPMTMVGYAVPAPGGHVTIDVYDVAGRHVATLLDEECDPGWYAVPWDGTGDSGERVASGVYFCRMQAPGFKDSKKLTVLK